MVEDAGRRDHDIDVIGVTRLRLEVPATGRERAVRDLFVEPRVLDDAVLARDPLEVRADLGAGRESAAPLGRQRERVRVEVRRNVAREAGIGVLAPGPAELVA